MEMVRKAHDAEHRFFGWFNYERRNWLAVVILALGLGAAYGESDLNQSFVDKKVAPAVAQKVQAQNQLAAAKKEIPKLQAQVNCQTARADVATASAIGVGVDPAAIPNCPAPTKTAR